MTRKGRSRVRQDATPKNENDETLRSVARRRPRIDRPRTHGGGHEGDLRTWLELLFLELPGSVELRAIDPESGGVRRRWIPKYEGKAPRIAREDLEDVAAAILEMDREGLNSYVGIATRAQRGGHKGDLGFIGAVWGDLDDPLWGNTSVEVLLKTCTELGFPSPSIVVDSGGGLHAYWLLDEPLQIVEGDEEGRKNLARLEAINRGIARRLGADKAATDAGRILRPPNTTNRPGPKKRAEGRIEAPVRLLLAPTDEAERRYALDDLAIFEEAGLSVADGERSTSTTEPRYERPEDVDAELPQRVREVLEADDQAGAKYHEKGDDDSADDMSLAMALVRRGCEGGEVELALRRSREERGAAKDPDAKGDGYFVRTVNRALEWVGNEADAPGRVPAAEDFKGLLSPAPLLDPTSATFECDERGRIYKNLHNAVLAVLCFDLDPRYDEMGDRTMLLGPGFEVLRRTFPRISREVNDAALHAIAWRIATHRKPRLPEFGKLEKALDLVAHHRAFNPVEDWLRGLEWDGAPRLDSWLVDYCHTPDSPYARAVGSILLRAAVARIFQPSVKYDSVVILEGPQGSWKSTS